MSDYTYGEMHFKLPTGAFEYVGIEDGCHVYYGKNDSKVNCVCCDVIISECDIRFMQQYKTYDMVLDMDKQTRDAILKQKAMVLQRGRHHNIIELITQNRTISLYVKACAGSYFRLTVGKSFDASVTISELTEFAYETLDTVRIDGDIPVSFTGLSRKSEEAKRKAEEEAKRKAEEEAKRKAEEEMKRKAEQEAKRKAKENKIREKRKAKNLCQHCGGSFKGIFIKKCRQCNKRKDY